MSPPNKVRTSSRDSRSRSRSRSASTSDRDWKRRGRRGSGHQRQRSRRSPSPRRRRPRSPRRRSSPSSTKRKSSSEDKRPNETQTVAFTDTKVAESLQADKQKLHTDLKYKFSKITLNLTEGNQKLELNGPPAEVKGAFMFLYHQLLKRFGLRYPQIRDVAFEISGPPAPGRQTPEPSPDRNKCKCHGVSREVRNEERPVPKANSNNEAAVTALSKELADWKKKFEILQNNAKSKCLEFQTELDKCKEDLAAKDQRNIDLEREKENLLKLDEVKTTQVGQAMEQVAGIYKKYEESQAKLQELEKGSVKAPQPDIIIKKEVDTEQQEMVRTRKELAETKKKLKQLEGKYIHKRTMLELKEKEVTQLRRENRRLEVENGRETVNCDGIVTVEVSP